MPKARQPTWAGDTACPRTFATWGEWLFHTTASAVAACQSRAEEQSSTLYSNPLTGYASIQRTDALRPIVIATVRRFTREIVHASLEDDFLLESVDWRSATEQVENRVLEILERRGYTVIE